MNVQSMRGRYCVRMAALVTNVVGNTGDAGVDAPFADLEICRKCAKTFGNLGPLAESFYSGTVVEIVSSV